MDVSFGAPGIKHILVGILIGFLTDFSTHGVEQEFVQKLKACKRPKSAIQAVMLSNILTVILQIIFILIGIVYSDILPKELGELNDSIEKFMFACRDTIPTGLKGIFVVGIISAAMSTLDSSLNALSSILWNDIILAKDNHRFSFYVKMDNIVIAVFVCIFVYFISNNPFYLNSFVNFNSFILYPIICTFLLRFVLNRFVSFEFSLHSFAFVSLGCVLGFVMNIFYLDLPVQTAVIPSLIISALIIRFYEFVKHWI